MHYYQFNIADYRKDTSHLTPVEHYIYRWLIDEYHLSEQPFNNNMPKLLRRMSLDETHRESLELILEEFFIGACDLDYEPVNIAHHPEYADIGGNPELYQYWMHSRVEQGINTYKQFIVNKSVAGKASAKARKNNSSTPVKQQPTGEQLTTNHKPLTTNQEPKIKTRASPFVPPTENEVKTYCDSRSNNINPTDFLNHYEANGWMRGKNKIKDWKACIRTWESNRGKDNGQNQNNSRAKRVNDKLREIARKDIIENGFVENLDSGNIREVSSEIYPQVDSSD